MCGREAVALPQPLLPGWKTVSTSCAAIGSHLRAPYIPISTYSQEVLKVVFNGVLRGVDMGGFVMELWAFMKERKAFWLLPILVVLLLLGSLMVLTQGSAVAPFIYTLF
jgi:Family of unknown function (DUF5989)